MRQYAGFGTAEESNRRYRYLLSQGTTGLSVAFDLPTQMGLDSDHPTGRGRSGTRRRRDLLAGRHGAPVRSIPLDQITTSMTINSTAAILLSLYVLVAQAAGRRICASSPGTIQNDILKEYIARGTYIYPPRPAMRIITDLFAWAGAELPEWNTISISGYHIREAGSTAIQEVAFTLAERHRVHRSGASTPGSMWTRSRRGFRSSSTRTIIFWKRSPSIARRGACTRRS